MNLLALRRRQSRRDVPLEHRARPPRERCLAPAMRDLAFDVGDERDDVVGGPHEHHVHVVGHDGDGEELDVLVALLCFADDAGDDAVESLVGNEQIASLEDAGDDVDRCSRSNVRQKLTLYALNVNFMHI